MKADACRGVLPKARTNTKVSLVPAFWFLFLALSCIVAYRAGLSFGIVRNTAARWALLAVCIAVLAAWTWLANHPEHASALIGANVLKYLEGTIAAPLSLLLLGVAWRRCESRRQRVFVSVGVLACAAFFIHGSLWMLQTTRPEDYSTFNRAGVVRQSQRFSCVPAACATALNRLGILTTEAEMAELTQTRWGTGATLVRALAGVNERLANTNYSAAIEHADWDRLARDGSPAIVLMRYESPRYHMSTILTIKPNVVLVADPAQGMMWLSRSQFEEAYTGNAILIRPLPPHAPVLAAVSMR